MTVFPVIWQSIFVTETVLSLQCRSCPQAHPLDCPCVLRVWSCVRIKTVLLDCPSAPLDCPSVLRIWSSSIIRNTEGLSLCVALELVNHPGRRV